MDKKQMDRDVPRNSEGHRARNKDRHQSQQESTPSIRHAKENSMTDNIPVQVEAILGYASMSLGRLAQLGRGAVIELQKKVGDPINIHANGRLVARGEIVITGDSEVGARITELCGHGEE